MPDAVYLHLFAVRGTVTLEGEGDLRVGDAARLGGTAGHRLTATPAAECGVWEMHARVARVPVAARPRWATPIRLMPGSVVRPGEGLATGA